MFGALWVIRGLSVIKGLKGLWGLTSLWGLMDLKVLYVYKRSQGSQVSSGSQGSLGVLTSHEGSYGYKWSKSVIFTTFRRGPLLPIRDECESRHNACWNP